MQSKWIRENINDKTENGHILFSIKELLQFNRWTTRENTKRLKFTPDWFIHWTWINYWPKMEYTVIELYLFSSIIDKDKKFGYNNRFDMFVGFTLILIDIWRKDLAARALFSLTLLQDDPVLHWIPIASIISYRMHLLFTSLTLDLKNWRKWFSY